VINQGTAPLTLIDNWVQGEGFSVSPQQALIAPNDSITLQISFTATSSQTESTGYLHIVSDDPEYPVRKPFLKANAGGVTVGSQLPPTQGTLLDGTVWSSSESTGNVLLLFYFATF
jgi:hypothetical protein